MNRQDMQKVGFGYAGGFRSISLTDERKDFLAKITEAGSDRSALSAILGSKLDEYFAWRMGGSSVLSTISKLYNW